MRRARLLAVAVIAMLPVTAGGAQAATWTEVPSGTTAEISSVEYQSPTRFWFTTVNGEIFSRNADGSFSRTFGPSAIPLNDIEFLPGSPIGLAVGNGGQVLRSANGGATWTNVNPGGTPIPVSKAAASSTFSNCTATEPLGNVNAVRFAGIGRAWIFAEGSQLATSQTGDPSTVGAVGTWIDANRDQHGTPADPADDTCKVPTSYNQGIDDGFFPASNPDVGYICTSFFGEVFRTTSDLAGTAAKTTGDCGNGTRADRIMTGDPDNPNRMWAVAPGDASTSYTSLTTDGWASSDRFTLVTPDKRPFAVPYDVDFAAGTVLVAGDAGMILNSIDGRNFSFADAGGALATEGWRAVSLASASDGAVAGVGGRLATTANANALPDVTAPTGVIAGPDSVAAGSPITLTAQVADEPGGSGINPGSLAWTTPGLPGQNGGSATFTFAAPGSYTVTLRFSDNAGNPANATKSVTVTAPTKATPTLAGSAHPPIAGGGAKRKGKYVVVKVRGRLGVPAGTNRTRACSGTMSLSVYKGKKRIAAKKARLTKRCRYAKTLKVKRTKVGKARRLKLKVAFKGNAVLAPLSSTYSVKVKR